MQRVAAIAVSSAAEAMHPGLAGAVDGAGGSMLHSDASPVVGTASETIVGDGSITVARSRSPRLTRRGVRAHNIAFADADLAFAAATIVALARGDVGAAADPVSLALDAMVARVAALAGFQRMFGLHAPTELGKAALKAALVFGAGIAVIAGALPGLITVGGTDPAAGADHVASTMVKLLFTLGVALGVVAALDLPLQLNRHRAKLRMSKQEVKQENRESDGSPETKAAQRRLARQAAKRALAPAVASATVVVVNPAHFAVALRYVPGRDAAPVVVAKGRDVIAEAIRDLAAERKIPTLRYPQLTRAIYFTATVGSAIKDELFGAVAAVLAFVLHLEDSAREQPDVVIPDAMLFDERGE